MNLLIVPWVLCQPWRVLETLLVAESQSRYQVCTQHTSWKEGQKEAAVEGKGECSEAFWKYSEVHDCPFNKPPLRNFSQVSDLEELCFPNSYFSCWTASTPLLFSLRDLTQFYQLNPRCSHPSPRQMPPYWPPCFHTGPFTMQLPHSSQDNLLET